MESFDSVVSPVDRQEIEQSLSICRAQLGDERFEAAWQAGRALTLEQALAEAQATLQPLPGSEFDG